MDNPTTPAVPGKTKAAPAPSLPGAAGVGPGPAQNSAPTRQVYRSFQELAAAFGVDPHAGRQREKRDWVDVAPEGARE